METCRRCTKPLQPPAIQYCASCWSKIFEYAAWRKVLAWLASLPALNQLQQARLGLPLDTAERSLFFSFPRAKRKDPLAKQVKAEWEIWRTVVTQQERQEQESSKAGNDIETLVGLFLALLDTSLTKRQVYYRYVRRRFHYDVVLGRWLSSIPQRVATPAEAQTLRGGAQAFAYHSAIIWAGLRAVFEGQAAGMDATIILAQAIQWIYRANREIPPQLVAALTESAHSAVQEAATLQLAGWAATQLSLSNARLQAILVTEDKSAFTTLMEWLPARVLLAWKDRHPLETLEVFNKRIRRYVLEDAPQGPSRNTRHILLHDEPSVEEMWVHEEIRREMNLDNLTARATLAPRETEIWAMVRQNIPYAEIATRLQIEEGTVKATMFRVREKLRKAANV